VRQSRDTTRNSETQRETQRETNTDCFDRRSHNQHHGIRHEHPQCFHNLSPTQALAFKKGRVMKE
jgi:hypothetical protein